MELLVTASIGLLQNPNGCYIQVIVDKDDRRQDFFIRITEAKMLRISRECNIEITDES